MLSVLISKDTQTSLSRYRSGMVDDMFVTEDGSYVFPNITKADVEYASDDGVEYYCTATNDFGTIRSPTVRAFYSCEWEMSLVSVDMCYL